ncbi:MAG: TetR/AcrR family transcriptional regulator [Bacillota bacterium]|nr:TetR/AcrR family transcriptional regulator [Bacillota bacterium]
MKRFDILKPEKQQRIISAALNEFTRNGYKKASTNQIIKEAGISKGSLFTYFKNKKELYLFLLNHVTKVIEEIYAEVDWSETDYFARLKQLGLVKYKVYKKYPQAFDFLNSTAKEDAGEVKKEIETLKHSLISSGMERGYENIDYSRFRTDIDLEKTKNLISLAILGLAEQQRAKVQSIDEVDETLLDEFDEYFSIMKRCFYKKEAQ